MKHLSVAVIISLISVLVLIFSDFGKSQAVIYDCGMAEWHPDIPKQVKEECRKLREEQRKQEKRIMT